MNKYLEMTEEWTYTGYAATTRETMAARPSYFFQCFILYAFYYFLPTRNNLQSAAIRTNTTQPEY